MALRKQPDGRPQISQVSPAAAIPGGEFQIRGKNFTKSDRAAVRFGDTPAQIVVSSDSLVIVKVPEGAADGEITIGNNGDNSTYSCDLGIQIADSVHPVASPAVDAEGNVFVTLSGQRGQKTPVSVYRIDTNYTMRPFLSDIMNATGLTFDREGMLYVSSRYDGIVYQVTPSGKMSVYVEGMGVATGMAFDEEGNLYVGDRSGTIFKIGTNRQIYVFATLEPSIAAYHLCFGPEGALYVTGPTTSSFDAVYRVAATGDVEVFYRGLGRPQGLAFDADNRLYVAASMGGRRGIVRINQEKQAELFLSGSGIVGLAFSPSRAMMVCTTNSVYRVDVGIRGRQS